MVAAIRSGISEHRAASILNDVKHSIDCIVKVPPGNLVLNQWDPKFRAASQKYKRIYTNRSERSVSRLAAVAAILYQVRCNIIHGSKDPTNPRDVMLIRESIKVLKAIMSAYLDADLTS